MSIETPPRLDVQQEILDVLAPLRERHAALEREEAAKLAEMKEALAQYRAALGVIQAGKEQLEAFLAQAGVEGFKARTNGSKPKKRSATRTRGVTYANGTFTGFGISMEAAAPFADAIKKVVAQREREGESPFVTQKEIYRSLNQDQTKGSAAFHWFRAIGFLRKAGRDSGSRRELWAIMDADAVDKALETASQAADERFQHIAEGATGETLEERAIAYIRDHSPVNGWSELCREIGATKGQSKTIRDRIMASGMVRDQARPGATSILTWAGENNENAA